MATNGEQPLDAIAAAIASAPRRTILNRLALGPATMSELGGQLEVSLPAVTKHLDLLLGAGLVRRVKHGRTVTVELVPGSLEPLQAWALSTRLVWATRLDRMAAYVTSSGRPTASCPATPARDADSVARHLDEGAP